MDKEYVTEDHWAVAPYRLKVLPNDRCLIIRADTGAICVTELWTAHLLELLRIFRSLDQHLQHILSTRPNFTAKKREIARALAELCRQGILVSGKQAYRRMLSPDAVCAPRHLQTVIAITTCDRPASLELLLSSLAENEEAFGGGWRYAIVDDSKQSTSWELNKLLAARFSRALNLEYHGLDERKAFLARILSELPEEGPSLEWLLAGGSDSSSTDQITYGAPKNYLMLRFAGARLLFVDDDAVLNPWIRLDAQDGLLGFGPIASSRQVAKDIETLLVSLRPLGRDPIAEHVNVLGLNLNEVLRLSPANTRLDDLLGQAEVSHLPRPEPRGCRIRVSMNGLLGDPGTADDLPLLFQDLISTSTAADQDRYRTLVGSARCVCNGQPGSLLTNQGYFHLATLAGIDLGDYFPPLVPVGRGEDALIGFFLQILYPGDLSLILPWALEHRPDPPRTWRINADHLPAQVTPAMALACWSAACGAGVSYADPQEKMTLLADHFLHLAGSQTGVNRLAADLDAAIKMIWAQRYGDIAKAFTSRGICPSLRADIDQAVLALQGLLARPRVVDAATLSRLLDSCRRYFTATRSWMRAQALIRGGGDYSSRPQP